MTELPMPTPKTKFLLITIVAIILAAITGIYLKQESESMSQVQMFGWGFVFIAALLTAVRGFRYLMSMR